MTTSARPVVIDAVSALLRREPVVWRALGVAPGDFLDVCASEDLIGLVHHARHAGPNTGGDDWPAEIDAALSRLARAEATREAVRREELVRVLHALACANVRPIVFKGTALAYGSYGAAARRPRLDTDLLIRGGDAPVATRVLTGLGYRTPPHCAGEVLLCQFAASKKDSFGIEHLLDIHWKISVHATFADLLTYDELAAGSVPLPSLGPHARAAGAVDALLLACVHPVMHHRGVERLLWLYDVHLLAERLPPAALEEFVTLALAKRVGAICAREVARARRRFRTHIPATVETALTPGGREPSTAFLEPGRRWHHEIISGLRDVPRWRDRVRLVREVLFPNPRYMLGAYAIGNRPWSLALLPALYVHRNVHGVWKVLAGRK